MEHKLNNNFFYYPSNMSCLFRAGRTVGRTRGEITLASGTYPVLTQHGQYPRWDQLCYVILGLHVLDCVLDPSFQYLLMRCFLSSGRTNLCMSGGPTRPKTLSGNPVTLHVAHMFEAGVAQCYLGRHQRTERCL
jgi:hypothetical protein